MSFEVDLFNSSIERESGSKGYPNPIHLPKTVEKGIALFLDPSTLYAWSRSSPNQNHRNEIGNLALWRRKFDHAYKYLSSILPKIDKNKFDRISEQQLDLKTHWVSRNIIFSYLYSEYFGKEDPNKGFKNFLINLKAEDLKTTFANIEKTDWDEPRFSALKGNPFETINQGERISFLALKGLQKGLINDLDIADILIYQNALHLVKRVNVIQCPKTIQDYLKKSGVFLVDQSKWDLAARHPLFEFYINPEEIEKNPKYKIMKQLFAGGFSHFIAEELNTPLRDGAEVDPKIRLSYKQLFFPSASLLKDVIEQKYGENGILPHFVAGISFSSDILEGFLEKGARKRPIAINIPGIKPPLIHENPGGDLIPTYHDIFHIQAVNSVPFNILSDLICKKIVNLVNRSCPREYRTHEVNTFLTDIIDVNTVHFLAAQQKADLLAYGGKENEKDTDFGVKETGEEIAFIYIMKLALPLKFRFRDLFLEIKSLLENQFDINIEESDIDKCVNKKDLKRLWTTKKGAKQKKENSCLIS